MPFGGKVRYRGRADVDIDPPSSRQTERTASRIPAAVVARTFRTQGGIDPPACTTVTSAPSRKASSARACPIRPVDRVVRTRTSSRGGSAHAPLVISTRFPRERPAGDRTLGVEDDRIGIGDLRLPLLDPGGSTTSIPQERSLRKFSATPGGWRYMLSCIAGTTTTGIRRPSAVVAKVVAGVSSIPQAILPMVLAVQGATSRRSASPPPSPPQ